MKKFLRVLGWSVVVLLLVGAYVGYRIIWGQPFTINQLANRQATFFLVRNPELFTMIGIADGTIVDRHSGKLAVHRDPVLHRDVLRADLRRAVHRNAEL